MQSLLLGSLLFLSPLVNVLSLVDFNFTTCPTSNEVETAAVAANFSAEYFAGVYYEIALHDYTQYPTCFFKPTCIQSYKTFNASYGKYGQILDHFSLECVGETYKSMFYDTLTDVTGLFEVKVEEAGHVTKKEFHDTVVATGDIITQNNTNGNNVGKQQYEWVMEFQCVQKYDRVLWTAINFYTYYNQPSQDTINTMLDIAYQQGLGVYLNKTFIYIDQENCTYPIYT